LCSPSAADGSGLDREVLVVEQTDQDREILRRRIDRERLGRDRAQDRAFVSGHDAHQLAAHGLELFGESVNRVRAEELRVLPASASAARPGTKPSVPSLRPAASASLARRVARVPPVVSASKAPGTRRNRLALGPSGLA
jgi:hypothetical protein